jgi:holin (3TMs family)
VAFDIAPYGAAIEATSNLLSGILKRVFPEKVSEETALKLNQELSLALLNGELQPVLAQLAVNAKEAEHDSVFVAGWRPFVGWVCGGAFAYTFILQPFMVFTTVLFKWQAPPLPVLDMMPMLTVLGGMLGLGAMRSYEKVKGETTTATKVGA